MSCRFTYNGIEANSMEELTSMLLAADPNFNVWDSALNFFNADGQQIANTLEGLFDKTKEQTKGKFQGITNTNSRNNVDETAAEANGNITDKNILGAWQSYLNYTASYGTLLHECINAQNRGTGYTEAVQRLIDYLTKEIKDKGLMNQWRQHIGNAPTVSATLSFLDTFFKDEFQKDAFTTMIGNTLAEIRKTFQTYHKGVAPKILTELVINDSSLGTNGMSAVLDAVTYDDDGNVIIWDFKTTNREIISEETKYRHYKQLAFYKQILIKQGIPASKIQVRNIQLQGLVENGEMKTRVTPVDPDALVSQTRKNDVALLLRSIFPQKGLELPASEVEARDKKLATITDTLITPLARTKVSKDQQVKILTKVIQNNQQAYLYQVLNERNYAGEVITHWEKQPDGTYIGYDSDNKQKVKGTIEEIAEHESEALLEQLTGKVAFMSNVLRNKSVSELQNMFLHDTKRKTAIQHALEPYMSPQYEYMQISVLEAHNIITMFDHATNSYSFIVVTDLVDIGGFRDSSQNILAPIFKDPKLLKEFKEFDEIPESSMQNVLTLQALMAINTYADALSDGPINISRIQVVSGSSGVSTMGCNMDGFMTCLKLLQYDAQNHADKMYEAGSFSDIYDNANSKIRIADRVETLRSIVVNRVQSFKFNNPDIGNDTFSSVAMDMTYDNIVDTLQKIKNEFPTEYLNVDNEIGRIYAELQQLKQTIGSGEFYNQLYKHTRKGLSLAETLGAGIDLFKYGDARKYSFNGMMMAGIAQSLETSSSYSNPDQVVAYYNQAFSRATQMITDELNALSVPLNLATKRFLQAAGKLGIQAAVLGNTNSEYEKLFEKDSNGQMSDQMLLVDPYKDSNLADYQREYIEEVLWVFNRLRMRSNLEEQYRKMSYQEFKKHKEAFEKYKKDVMLSAKWRQAPLMLKDGVQGTIEGVKSLFRFGDDDNTLKERVKKFGQNLTGRWLQNIEPLLLSPEQRTEMDKSINVQKENFEFHSPYNAQGAHRVEMVNAHRASEWECNLNILALEYACAQFKEIYFHDLLSSVSDLLGVIKLQEVMSGQDLSNTKEALINRMKISVYNTSLIDNEDRGIALAVSGVKRLTSYAKIAVRPALFVKEMVLGVIKNVSVVWAKNIINDNPITYQHLMEAAGIVYTNGLFSENAGKFEGETFGDFRLINKINNQYRINDRDLSVLGESLAYDHSGITRLGPRMLYLNTTSPDWFNRMMIMIAKMKADGTWEAHSVDKDGNLVYDVYKDKRYAPFLDWYKSHKNGGKEPTDEEFVKAKALYKLRIEQFRKEGYTNLTASYTDDFSLLPRCYTVQEMDSLKEQIGMMYGYYTHEERASVQKGISWLLHTQFLTFLPGEIRKYLASGNFDSCVGKVQHLIDPITKKPLYYHKNAAGLTEKVTEDKLSKGEEREPVLEFVNTPIEGILVSTIKTARDIWKGDFDRKLKPEQWDRTKLFLLYWLLAHILGGILLMLSSMGIDAKKSSEAGKATLMSLDLMRRVSSELNGIETLTSPIANYGIAGTDFVKQAMSSISSLVTSDSYTMLDAINANLPIVKDFHLN